MRGKPYDDQNYLTQLRVLEDIVIDMILSRHRIKHRNLGLLDNFFCQFFFYFSVDNVFGPLFGPFFYHFLVLFLDHFLVLFLDHFLDLFLDHFWES